MAARAPHPHHRGMTEHPYAPPAARTRVAQGLTVMLAALVVAVIGYLLFAASDWQSERLAGIGLMAAAALAALAGAVTLRRGSSGAGALPLLAAGALVLAGVVAAVLLATRDTVFAADLVVAAGVPVAAGALTWFVAGPRRGH
jgi:hypothetical protein